MAEHTALAKQLGVSEALLDALYHIDEHRHLFSEREVAALRFAEIMTTGAREVSEALWMASLLKLPPLSVCSISLIASRMHFRYFHLSRVLRGPIANFTGLVFAPATLGHVLQGFLETA